MGELVLAYNRANRQAAILCNHQRTVPKSFDASMVKMSERVHTHPNVRTREDS